MVRPAYGNTASLNVKSKTDHKKSRNTCETKVFSVVSTFDKQNLNSTPLEDSLYVGQVSSDPLSLLSSQGCWVAGNQAVVRVEIALAVPPDINSPTVM